jgi:Tol biopolymer transport system component
MGKIVYIALDGNVALTNPTGTDQKRVTTNANASRNNQPFLIYTYPTFSPDASALTFVGYTVDGDVISQTLYRADATDSANLLPLYSTSQYNIPYADWSPDGQTIAFLTIDPQQGYLRLAGKDGGIVREVERGSSVYWNWRNDSAALFTHLGGSQSTDADAHHAIVDAGAQGAQRITTAPGYYKSPHYSPDGRYVLYVERTANADELVIADSAGVVQCSVAILDTGASFAWSPDGKRVAWIDSGATSSLTAPLVVLDLQTGKSQRLHNDAIAFFWSPDSERVAVYSVATAPVDKPASGSSSTAAQSVPALRIEVVNVTTANRVLVADTSPSRAVVDVLNFFDQYARALTPWSPAGDQLVFTDLHADASTIDMIVATLHADAISVTLKRIGSAAVAFWSPR